MKPYFETKLGKVYHGDCLEVMKELDIKFDLVLTDPPYGINADKGLGHSGLAIKNEYTDNWDNFTPDETYFAYLMQYDSIIFGGNYFTDKLPQNNHWLVWDKKNSMPTYSDCELIYTNIKRNNVKIYAYISHGMLQENMKNKEERFHPTQKPVGLIMALLKDYSKKDYLILDPFAGSGTTGVACHRLNRRYILIEKELKYCEIIKERLIEETEKGKLFNLSDF